MIRWIRILGLLPVCFFNLAQAGDIYADVSEVNPDPDKYYLFYSHGYIVEGEDPKPEHPRWGVYDFPADVKALAATDYQVIAYHRPAGTVPMKYAKTLVKQVESLLNAGVPQSNSAILGFSRGGRITAYASHLLKDTPVATAD